MRPNFRLLLWWTTEPNYRMSYDSSREWDYTQWVELEQVFDKIIGAREGLLSKRTLLVPQLSSQASLLWIPDNCTYFQHWSTHCIRSPTHSQHPHKTALRPHLAMMKLLLTLLGELVSGRSPQPPVYSPHCNARPGKRKRSGLQRASLTLWRAPLQSTLIGSFCQAPPRTFSSAPIYLPSPFPPSLT